ncbi:vomeronasal type-2 receptor 26-like [Rhinatrema bivittatum]|uniref:vomeronasal type-2 receptor 26-like n=1 Tax=Rhinatrema bivittatum TaxID=194408 RepID=UPI001126D60F|nr:vomeronasal type-2 receptor 26-like [Rhinatrema bivittatum]
MYPPFPEINLKDSPAKILLECNENSRIAFYCMLGFLSLLAGISFLVAFQARKLPDYYNESKWIAFSMTVFLSVWTSFLPAYLSTRGKYMVAVEIFAILSSSTGVLAFIFLPKCYIILLTWRSGSVTTFSKKQALSRKFYPEKYQCALAMVFATEEINQNPKLLPNVTLGFRMFDSCYSEAMATQGVMWMLTGRKITIPNYTCQPAAKMAAILGDVPSSVSIQIARILGLQMMPQISYGSGLPVLGEKLQFPSFLRTIGNIENMLQLVAQMMVHFSWTWVGILFSSTDYGLHGAQVLMTELAKLEVCVAFSESLGKDKSLMRIRNLVKILSTSSAEVIIVYGYPTEIGPVLEEMTLRQAKKVLIFNSALIVSPLFFSKRLWEVLNGTIGIIAHSMYIPSFSDFQYKNRPSDSSPDIFLKPFWEHVFECEWKEGSNKTGKGPAGEKKPCMGTERLEDLPSSTYDVNNMRFSYCAYNAVYALAHALHNMLYCNLDRGNCSSFRNIQPWQVLQHLKRVHFWNPVGEEMYFNERGETSSVIDIINWQLTPDGGNRYLTVGFYDPLASKDNKLSLNESLIQWGRGYFQIPRSVCSESCPPGYRKVSQEGQPVCCFYCSPCPEGEISNQTDAILCIKCPNDHWSNQKRDRCIRRVVEFLSFSETLGACLGAAAIFLSVIAAFLLVIFIQHRHSPIVRANNRGLSYLLLVSLIFCSLCSLIFIGKPVELRCTLRQTAFGLVFSFCVACILAKTTVVVVAFKARSPDSMYRSWLGYRTPVSIILSCLSIQAIICFTWVSMYPPFPEFNWKDSPAKILLECNENSRTAFYCMLGFLSLLAGISFLVAFQARKLPDRYNESKWIAFSMTVFLSVWTSFLPAYLSTRGKYMVAVEIFAILSSSTGVLACIFLPKCYIILLTWGSENVTFSKKQALSRK